MRKINCIFVIVMAFILAGTGIEIFFTRDKKFSENENRYLTERPKLSLSEIENTDFQKSLENFISDQIPLRESLITIRSELKELIGIKDIEGAYIGKDGYYLEKITNEDVREEQLKNNIRYINSFLNANKELKSYVMLIPGSGNILTDKLPKNAEVYNYLHYKKIAEKEFVNTKDETANKTNLNINVIDTYDELKKECNDYIYYRTDHHWTTKGAYIAYKQFCIAAGFDSGAYEDLLMENVTDNFFGTLYSKVLDKKKKGDSIDIAKNIPECNVIINGQKSEIYHMDKVKKKDKYQVFFGGNYGLVTIENTEYASRNERNLLVIKDSYANSFIPFMIKNYKTIAIVDFRYFNGNVNNLVDSNNITDVLVLYEMSNFMKDKNLVKMMLQMNY